MLHQDRYQLTCLVPHNELGDGYCQHLLIIPMIQMLPVMSYLTIFGTKSKAVLHAMRGESNFSVPYTVKYILKFGLDKGKRKSEKTKQNRQSHKCEQLDNLM